MPYPVDYRPYTAAHLLETLQLLSFTGIAFWLVMDKISAKSGITLDFDWFYRRPAPFLFRLLVVSLNQVFAHAERATLRGAQGLARISADPLEFAVGDLPDGRHKRAGGPDRAPDLFDPDRYRLPVGMIVLIVLVCFLSLMAWTLFRP
jgi:multicomponent Na+:H+ antiporter subunit D